MKKSQFFISFPPLFLCWLPFNSHERILKHVFTPAHYFRDIRLPYPLLCMYTSPLRGFHPIIMKIFLSCLSSIVAVFRQSLSRFIGFLIFSVFDLVSYCASSQLAAPSVYLSVLIYLSICFLLCLSFSQSFNFFLSVCLSSLLFSFVVSMCYFLFPSIHLSFSSYFFSLLFPSVPLFVLFFLLTSPRPLIIVVITTTTIITSLPSAPSAFPSPLPPHCPSPLVHVLMSKLTHALLYLCLYCSFPLHCSEISFPFLLHRILPPPNTASWTNCYDPINALLWNIYLFPFYFLSFDIGIVGSFTVLSACFFTFSLPVSIFHVRTYKEANTSNITFS